MSADWWRPPTGEAELVPTEVVAAHGGRVAPTSQCVWPDVRDGTRHSSAESLAGSSGRRAAPGLVHQPDRPSTAPRPKGGQYDLAPAQSPQSVFSENEAELRTLKHAAAGRRVECRRPRKDRQLRGGEDRALSQPGAHGRQPGQVPPWRGTSHPQVRQRVPPLGGVKVGVVM
eukprot:CAMPEP_0206035926 /NCGR_PEP_ID=MMETSP1466-20131121/2429_1 /ASSEMBLY_ACC=CAM_ASM_001126 /TAXON_ID=44452 /ORGANISM="Pavlova gyrans, Strain CCMP608" /LENGTH=171 /DNA_ID=CAMNT_0053410355 /DNA_START=16 /DNA_END=533 /DNA_ORIENTATION=+